MISPSLSPITESCAEKGKSAGKKNKILSSSCPSCCPLLKSNMQNFMPSAAVVAADIPILSPTTHKPWQGKGRKEENEWDTTQWTDNKGFLKQLNQTNKSRGKKIKSSQMPSWQVVVAYC